VPLLFAAAIGLAACGGKGDVENVTTENSVSAVDEVGIGNTDLTVDNETLGSANALDAGLAVGDIGNAEGNSAESSGNAL
jgi:hypothetical protein